MPEPLSTRHGIHLPSLAPSAHVAQPSVRAQYLRITSGRVGGPLPQSPLPVPQTGHNRLNPTTAFNPGKLFPASCFLSDGERPICFGLLWLCSWRLLEKPLLRAPSWESLAVNYYLVWWRQQKVGPDLCLLKASFTQTGIAVFPVSHPHYSLRLLEFQLSSARESWKISKRVAGRCAFCPLVSKKEHT